MGTAISFGRHIFRSSTFFWLLLASAVVTAEALIHERITGIEMGDRFEHVMLLLAAVLSLSFHYESVKITPRLIRGTSLLMIMALLVGWATSLQVLLCVEILFIALFFRILNRHLFVLSRLMVLGIALFFVFETVFSARHNLLEIFVGLLLVELTFHIVVALDREWSKGTHKKGLKFEFRNILSIAFGGRRTFWEDTFLKGEWEFLDSADQSPRHIMISGLVSNGIAGSADLLDVGCGHATLLSYLSRNVNYVGVDMSETVTTANREKYGERATFIAADLFSYAPEGKKFDAIVLNEVLYYVPLSCAFRALRHCANLLRNDESRLIISMNKNPKALLLWEMLNYSFPSESVFSIENHQSGSRWYLRSFTKSSIHGTGLRGNQAGTPQI